LLWLPNLIVALVVLVIGGLAANALSQVVRGATASAGFSNPEILATVTKVAVWGFAMVVALTQLGIATTLINTLVIGLVGALSLATGLAFGLGGRDRAAQLLDTLASKAQRTAPKLERAATAVREQAPVAVQPVGEPIGRVSGNTSWIARSPTDRRRVERPGVRDRRIGNGTTD
jgi:hypothetical protein